MELNRYFQVSQKEKEDVEYFELTLLSVESAAIECAWAWDFRATGRTEAVCHPLQGK